MAVDIPTPRAYPVILGGILNSFLSRYGLSRIKVGGPILSIMEAAARSDLRSTQDIFNLLDATNLNRARGVALDRIAADEDAQRRPATAASGKVTFYDTSFSKIATSIYPGAAAPNAGSTSIRVSDGSHLPATGAIYLGRGTLNYEGPVNYTSVAKVGTYWVISLATATQKFHDVSESVILAQGGTRSVPSGSLVQTPQGNATTAISYTTLFAARIEDGETQVENVPVVAQERGTVGNIPKGAISDVSGSPFTGVAVTNPLPFSNGLAFEDDDTLRERIRALRQSRSKGTALSIVTNARGVTASDENKTVIGATLVSPKGEPATLYIDDGTGYEVRTEGIAYETLMDQAIGGEYNFQLSADVPVTKAFVKTTLAAPFGLVAGAKLAVRVGGVLTEHSFSASEFRSISNATAFEVVAAINGNSDLNFSARTSDDNTTVTVFSRSETNEDILVLPPDSGTNANAYLGFTTGLALTLRLYKNNQLLYKDGLSAEITSAPQAAWSQSISNGVKLDVSIDGTPAVTYTFNNSDFVNAGTAYTTVAATNSIASWATVINAKVPGITAQEANGRLVLTSNAGASTRASVVLSEPTGISNNLIQRGMFTTGYGLQATGASFDYTLDRNTGQIKLVAPLKAGDELTAGTQNTRAYVQGAEIGDAILTLASPGGSFWLAVDGAAESVSTDVSGSTSFDVTSLTSTSVRYTANSAVFGTGGRAYIQVGDWVVIWSASFNVKGYWRIIAVDPSFQYFDVNRANVGLQTGAIPTDGGMVFVRSATPIQEIRVSSGVNRTLTSISNEINQQLRGATASVFRNRYLRITTNTEDPSGDIAVATADVVGRNFGLPLRTLVENTSSHLASLASSGSTVGTPSFDLLATTTIEAGGQLADVSDITSVDQLLYGVRAESPAYGNRVDDYLTIKGKSTGKVTPRYLQGIFAISVGGLVRTTNVVTATTTSAHGFRAGDIVFVGNTATADGAFAAGFKLVISTPSSTNFTYAESGANATSGQPYSAMLDLHVLTTDIFAPTSPLAIGPDDSLNVIVDGDQVSKNFSMPLWRRIKAYSGAIYSSSGFAVVDADNSNLGLDVAFSTADTDVFRDFALYMNARGKSHPNNNSACSNKALLWRYTRKGPEGNYVKISYTNPTAPSQSFAIATSNDKDAHVQIRLPSDAARTGLQIQNTTRFTVGVSGTAVTYTYSSLAIDIGGAVRVSNSTTITTTTAHGFAVGDVIYLTSTDPSFAGGPKTIVTAPSGTTFIYIDYAANATSTIAMSVSSANAPVNLSAVQVGDIVTISSSAGFNVANTGTYRVNSRTGTSFTVRSNGSPVVETTPKSLNAVSNISFYPLSATTASAVADWVNANASDVVTATPVENGGGAPGTGVLNKATTDEFLDNDDNGIVAGVADNVLEWGLTDGINYILQSNLGASPNTISLKNAVNPTLTSNVDFANEDMRLVPITLDGLVRFLSSPAISGFYSSAAIIAAVQGRHLQIASDTLGTKGILQVIGGNANDVTAVVADSGTVVSSIYSKISVPKSQSAGLTGWVAAQASNVMPKTAAWEAGGASMALDADGTVTFSGISNVWNLRQTVAPAASTRIHRVGHFAVYVFDSETLDGSVQEGDWVDVQLTGANTTNRGTFRLVRKLSDGSGFWVENKNAISESVGTGGTVKLYSYDSVMPGDTLIIDSDTFGAGNKGSFVVTALGTTALKFIADAVFSPLTATALGTNSIYVRLIEAEPIRLIKQIRTIGRNALDAGFVDVVFANSTFATKLSAAAGVSLQCLDKLGFATDVVTGADAYHHTVGLIGEVTKVLYGDQSNPYTYPGVVAAGANVNVDGPLIKRVTVSLAIRLRSKATRDDVTSRVRSAVAAAINSVQLGKPVALGAVVAAAQSVSGVAAVTILSPTYSSGNDLIPVQANEKARILDVDEDIFVSIVGA